MLLLLLLANHTIDSSIKAISKNVNALRQKQWSCEGQNDVKNVPNAWNIVGE